ncbi:MAG: HupE/UreJ family protein [Bradyrhizobiaceae bacterium]|nr:HupE/UreJ family protein [Bradyrhizobiaceae bacterium]
MRMNSVFLGLLVALLIAGPAYAHTGDHPVFSFTAGLEHPLGGLDHLLAMFAVGLLAAQLGGRAVWLVPGAFVAMMLVGALAGFSGVELPGIELGIALSIIAISLPVAFALGMPALTAMAYVGVFALFHGFAHGAELPADGAAAPYMLGFAISTALIHAAGIAVGLAGSRLANSAMPGRIAAAGVAAAGLVLAIA